LIIKYLIFKMFFLIMENKKRIVVLTGAGISAESGIKTFRDADGLWENHDVMEVASLDGWRKNRELVLRFYNDRRRQLFDVQPNLGHTALVGLEEKFQVDIITQNVDDLHERAGSTNILHLHGRLRGSCSANNKQLKYDCEGDINLGDKAEDGAQLRPDIVWFGEDVPLMRRAAELVHDADYLLVIGSSMQVYPAASLVDFAQRYTPIWYIDPNPAINHELKVRTKHLTVIAEKASIGVPKVIAELMAL
jgi:NAD-dependent deacetylase